MNTKLYHVGQQILDLLVVLLLGAGAVSVAIAYSPFHQHPFALMFLFFVLAVWYGTWWQACLGLCEAVLAATFIFHKYGGLNAEILLFIIAGASLITVVHSQRLSRQRLLEALDNARLLQGRHNAILDNAPNGVISFDPQGKIIEFTRPTERLFGYSAQEVLGANISKLFTANGYTLDMLVHEEMRSRYLGKPAELVGIKATGEAIELACTLVRYELREGLGYSLFVRERNEKSHVITDSPPSEEQDVEQTQLA